MAFCSRRGAELAPDEVMATTVAPPADLRKKASGKPLIIVKYRSRESWK